MNAPPPHTKLNETTDFIQLYRHCCGQSECPDSFHFWACMSLLAATVENRIWIEKFKGSKLTPNLYIFFVAPGALGKGVALGIAHRLLQDARIGTFVLRGKTTRAAFINRCAVKVDAAGNPLENEAFKHASVLFMHDELKHDIGSGGIAEEFIEFMTEAYTGGDYDMEDSTAARGFYKLVNPCFNWLAGTTAEWLLKAFSRDAIFSGFTARCVYVFERIPKKSEEKRYFRPIYPNDYDIVRRHLRARLLALTQVEGPCAFTADATAWEKHWYETRLYTDDEETYSVWKRGHDMLLKFAMILALSSGNSFTKDRRLLIQKPHMEAAEILYTTYQKAMDVLHEIANAPIEATQSDIIWRYLMEQKTCHKGPTSKRQIIRALYKKGVNNRNFEAAMQFLRDKGMVKLVGIGKNGAEFFIGVMRRDCKLPKDFGGEEILTNVYDGD